MIVLISLVIFTLIMSLCAASAYQTREDMLFLDDHYGR